MDLDVLPSSHFNSLDDATLYEFCKRLPYPSLLTFLQTYPRARSVSSDLLMPLILSLLYQAHLHGFITVVLENYTMLLFCSMGAYDLDPPSFLERFQEGDQVRVSMEITATNLVNQMRQMITDHWKGLDLPVSPNESFLYYGCNEVSWSQLNSEVKLYFEPEELDEAIKALTELLVKYNLLQTINSRKQIFSPYALTEEFRDLLNL